MLVSYFSLTSPGNEINQRALSAGAEHQYSISQFHKQPGRLGPLFYLLCLQLFNVMALHPKPAVYYLCVLQYSFGHQTGQAIIFNSLHWHLLHDFNSKYWLICYGKSRFWATWLEYNEIILDKHVQLMGAEVYTVLLKVNQHSLV